jgi:hypothetical protein
MSSPNGGDDDGPRKPGDPKDGPAASPPGSLSEGSDVPPTPVGEAPEGDDDTPEGAEIIAWPGRRRESAAEAEPANDAEDLVVKTLSSITGRDPADLLKELRAREAAEHAAHQERRTEEGAREAGQVIDLGAVRAARERAQHGGGAELGGVAREAFRAVMDALAKLQPEGGELVIDRDFVKAHGPTLLGSVLETVGKALLGQKAPAGPRAAAADINDEADDGAEEHGDDGATAPTGETPDDTDTTPSPPPPARPVEVRFDLGSLAVGLLSRLGMFRGTIGSAEPGPPADFDATSLGAAPPDDGGPDDEGPGGPEGT